MKIAMCFWIEDGEEIEGLQAFGLDFDCYGKNGEEVELSPQAWKRKMLEWNNHVALKDKAMVYEWPRGTYLYWSNEYGSLHLIILLSGIIYNNFLVNTH